MIARIAPGASFDSGFQIHVKRYPDKQLVDDWIAWAEWARTHVGSEEENPQGVAFFELGWLVQHDAEKAWEIIQRIFSEPHSDPVHGNLAAGPLEDLLSAHGTQSIERIESRAASDRRFALMVGGMWQHTMTSAIWQRVQAAAAGFGGGDDMSNRNAAG